MIPGLDFPPLFPRKGTRHCLRMKTTKRDIEPLLTPAQVAKLTGLDLKALYRRRRNGTGPAFLKLGSGRAGAIRYRASAIRAWLRECECRSTDDYMAGRK